MLTKNKLNTGIRERLLKQQEESGGKNDPLYLNYFDLEIGQQMEILLLADDSGELFYEYSTHAVKRVGTKTIQCCYAASRVPCAPCQYGFSLYQDGNKDDSQQWRKKNHMLAQCIVLKSPIDIPETEDGNMVKLIHVPFAISEMIKDGMINGTVSDPTQKVLVIKKTKKNANSQYAAYDKSFFKNESPELPAEFIEAYDAGLIVARNLKEHLPPVASEDELKEWLATALAANPFRSFGGTKTDDSTEADPAPIAESKETPGVQLPASTKSLKERLNERRSKS